MEHVKFRNRKLNYYRYLYHASSAGCLLSISYVMLNPIDKVGGGGGGVREKSSDTFYFSIKTYNVTPV